MPEKKLDRKPHDGRDDLVGEHKIGDTGQVILFIIFFIVWIIDCFIYEFSEILLQNISLFIRLPIAIIVCILAVYLAKASLKIIFDEVREIPQEINK